MVFSMFCILRIPLHPSYPRASSCILLISFVFSMFSCILHILNIMLRILDITLVFLIMRIFVV